MITITKFGFMTTEKVEGFWTLLIEKILLEEIYLKI